MTLRSFCGLLLALAAACSSSRSPEVYGAATIGPEGGELAVDSGPQAGLLLTVPPGALAAPTQLRVVAATSATPVEIAALTMLAPLADAFEVQPASLVLALPASLRAPFRRFPSEPSGQGNVRVRRLLGASSIDIDPSAVDVLAGRVEAPVAQLGRYQVVRGPVASGIAEYWQPVGTSTPLVGGFTFAVEEVPVSSPFGGFAATRWRVTGPGVDESLYFDGDRLLGRESATANWREVWSEPYPAWRYADQWVFVPIVTQPTSVEAPTGAPGVAGEVTVWSAWRFASPRRVADRLLCDVVELHVLLAWNRPDLGVGQSSTVFWFAPGVGLVAFAQDGVERARTSL